MSDPIKDTTLPITILDETINHAGFRTLKTFRYAENASGAEASRELVTTRDVIGVIAFDPTLEKLVMIRQFRLGAQLGTGAGMCVEIVAGMIDEGESPAQAAVRELEEETGLFAKRAQKLCRFLTTPGLTTEVLHLYFVEVDASNLASRAGARGENERTFPFLLSLDEALEAVDTNGIQNAIAITALLWFARHKDELIGTDP